MNQIDLDGFVVPYCCKKCGKCFETMKESSKHHATVHRKRPARFKSTNYTLEPHMTLSTNDRMICRYCGTDFTDIAYKKGQKYCNSFCSSDYWAKFRNRKPRVKAIQFGF